jgi:hypothetical protein
MVDLGPLFVEPLAEPLAEPLDYELSREESDGRVELLSRLVRALLGRP